MSVGRAAPAPGRGVRTATRLCAIWLFLTAAGAAGARPYVAADVYTLEPPGAAPVFASPGPQAAAGRRVVGFVSGGAGSDPTDAALVWDRALGPVALHPAGYYASKALATDGARQVGQVTSLRRDDPEEGAVSHAALWAGSAAVVDLHPTNLPGFSESAAKGLGGAQQVGYGDGRGAGGRHALLWHGSAASAVDLHPPGFATTLAYGTDGARQVGYGRVEGGRYYALLWEGSAATAVNLHPINLAGLSDSVAFGVGGGQQVGYGQGPGPAPTGATAHALLWAGTADAVDLHPTGLLGGFTGSVAYGTNGSRQVGYGQVGPVLDGVRHALVWEGAAASAVDLHLLLPPGFTSSQAHTIDAAGAVFGTAVDAAGRLHAVEWALPEPAGALWFTAGALALRRRRRSKHAGTP